MISAELLESALKRYFNYDAFLDHQQEVISRIVSGENLCVVMPTGAGKSLCYQLPALVMPGYTLVISPLIALMADQVAALRSRGISAAFINSTVTFPEQLEILRETTRGEIKLLYVAPERLQTDIFRSFLQHTPPQLLVVDEAHCISEWGHDFRPSYRRIGPIAKEFGIDKLCAFTATATPEVSKDIREQLMTPDMSLVAAGFRRPNLSFRVHKCSGGKETKLAALKGVLEQPVAGATLIYAATRQAVDELASLPNVQKYHAGMSNIERNAAQEYFMNHPSPVLAATNAFGMGIDRSDVRRVIHYQIPGSLEAYYQEAGRAGRDGESAECVLLFSYADKYIQNFLIEMNNPPPDMIRKLYTILRKMALQKDPAGEAVLEVSPAALAEKFTSQISDGQISAALGILEKSGAIARSARQTGNGQMRFLQNIDHLKMLHQLEKTQRSRFIHRVANFYGGALAAFIACNVETLADVAGLSVEQTRRVINALNGEILEWQSGFSGRSITICNINLTEPDLDDAELSRHLDYEKERLEAVVRYASGAGCRQRTLIGYFGENPDSWQCGCCDNCSDSDSDTLAFAGISPSDVRIALRAAEIFSGRIGIGKLGQILAGSRSSAIVSGNWHRNPCFGALRKLRSAKVEQLLRSLENAGLLERIERGGYWCIAISDAGRDELRQESDEPVRF